jgi:hypothetical protein
MLQPKVSSLNQRKFQLKPVSWAVILAEGLDLATTFGGFSLFPQMWEANPVHGLLGGWGLTILAKLIATLLVVLILERVDRWPRPVWLVPVTASLPVLWNLASILAEIMV